MAVVVQVQVFLGSSLCPQGQGFMAAMRVKSQGNLYEAAVLLMRITLSSRGWRRQSSNLRGNSAISSRNKIPL